MKKGIISVAAMALFAILFFAQGQLKAQTSDNGWIGRARGELSSCLAGLESNFNVTGSVSRTTYPCLIPPCPEEITVTFVAAPRCAPGAICPLYVMLAGEVVFDSFGNVLSTKCWVTTTH